jgi:hypothetical protein
MIRRDSINTTGCGTGVNSLLRVARFMKLSIASPASIRQTFVDPESGVPALNLICRSMAMMITNT